MEKKNLLSTNDLKGKHQMSFKQNQPKKKGGGINLSLIGSSFPIKNLLVILLMLYSFFLKLSKLIFDYLFHKFLNRMPRK